MKSLKLRQLIEGFSGNPGSNASPNTSPQVNTKPLTTEERQQAMQKISAYNELGEQLRRAHGLVDIANKLSEITEIAERIAMEETGKSNEAWFNENTVNKNFQQLRKISEAFAKQATEAHGLQQEMEALYEDAGFLIERYYKVNEGIVESTIGK